MDVTANPQQNFMARVPHRTIDKTIEAIMCLKDYTTMKMAEVVQYLLHIMYVLYISFSLLILLGPLRQIVVRVQNLIRHCSHIFKQLKEKKKIRAYLAHDTDCQKELSSKLETTKASEAIARKVTIEGTGM